MVYHSLRRVLYAYQHEAASSQMHYGKMPIRYICNRLHVTSPGLITARSGHVNSCATIELSGRTVFPGFKTISAVTIPLPFEIVAPWTGFTIGHMTTLARFRVGRIFLHLLAMAGDRCGRFHLAGIIRELPWFAAALTLLTRMRTRLLGALVLYLTQPASPATTAAAQSLAAILDRGDVLLSDGNTRAAGLIKLITQSTWSHVSMYVGPLEEGPDPRCIVEADIAAGVRSIRLSELNALQVRVLRPIGLSDLDRCRLADSVVSRIGCEYDLAHAWVLGRNLLPLPARLRSSPNTMANSATRFICCSLLAHAFALVGHPILPVHTRVSLTATVDHRNLIPGDFERAPVFEVVRPANNVL